MKVNNPGKIILLNSEVLEKVNHSIIAKLFDRSLFISWPQGILHDNILLFVSDVAPYTVKAGKFIRVLYSKMAHISYLACAKYSRPTQGSRRDQKLIFQKLIV